MRVGAVVARVCGILLVVGGRGFALDSPGTGASPLGEVAVPVALAADVRVHLARERGAATRALWGWSIVGVGAGTFAGLALAGQAGGGPAVESVAWVGTLAGIVGVARAVVRGRSMNRLDKRLAADFTAASDRPAVTLAPETRDATDRELRGGLTALRSSARGALRAGCVLPVLLGGIGAYGVSAGGAGGDALAGLGLGGALVIGAPSVLTYWGLAQRLARMEDLVARWDRALGGGEKIQ